MRTVDDATAAVVLVAGSLVVDMRTRRAALAGRTLPLSPAQFELLGVLVANQDRVVSRAELARAAGLEQVGSVDVLLSSLRRLLGQRFVRNVRNRGWILQPSAFGTRPRPT
jgi:DNA-binding response OmpR family regulator